MFGVLFAPMSFWFCFFLIESEKTNANDAFKEVLIKDFIETKRTSAVFVLVCAGIGKDEIAFQKHLSNITYTTTIDPRNIEIITKIKRHVAILVLDECANNFLIESGNLLLFHGDKHWLLISKNKNWTTFQNVNFNIDSDVNVAILLNDKMAAIYDVYNQGYKHGGRLKVTQIGYYTMKEQIYPKFDGAKYWRRKDMSGVSFKTSIVMPDDIRMPLHQYLYTDEFSEIGSLNRFQFNVVKHCKELHNFTISVSKVNSWGYLQPDGTIDGLVNLLNKTKVDFGASPLFCRKERLPSVDYSVGGWIMRSTFIYRRPKHTAPPLEMFVRPFSLTVWLCVLATMIAIIFLIAFVLKCEKRAVEIKQETNLFFTTIWSFSVMCQQGTFHTPISSSGRIILWIFLVFSVLLYQFYSSYILSYILMDPPRVINNLKDLLDSSLNAGSEDVGYDKDYFAQTTDPIAKRLYSKKIRNDTGFYLPPIGLEMVNKGGFAYHVGISAAYPIIKKTFTPEAICELEEIQMYRTQLMYTNTRKHSPFKQMFDHCARRLQENGNMYRLRRYWDAQKPTCFKRNDKIIAVGLQEFSCALILLLFGIILSVCFLICEIWYYRNSAVIKPYIN